MADELKGDQVKSVALLTPKIERQIAAFIRAGGFPHVAAEAAGIPRAVFEDWLARSQVPRASKKLKSLYQAVVQAKAQARLTVEIQTLQEKPMDWLKSGPGRETADTPGWTAPARPRTEKRQETDLLANPELQQLLRALLDVLTPFPDARAAVEQAYANVSPITPSRSSKK